VFLAQLREENPAAAMELESLLGAHDREGEFLPDLPAISPPLPDLVDETADVLSVSTKTVKRDWNIARAWLRRELIYAVGASAANNQVSASVRTIRSGGSARMSS
jgi:hypothetical protein